MSNDDEIATPITCSFCGAVVPPKSRFCNTCGAVLNFNVVELDKPINQDGIIYCPNCGSDNLAESVFCNKCGASFEDSTVVEVDTSNIANHDDILYCPSCKREIPVGGRFCDRCGAEIRINDWKIAVRGKEAKEVQQVAQSLLINAVTKAPTESIGKIKVLFLAANPINTAALRLDEEIRAITKKVRASNYRDSIELVSAWAIRADDLLQLLNEHRPHIVHFSGHGNSNGEIILVDSNGIAKPVNKVALSFLFSTLKDNIRAVVLNACYSRVQAEAICQTVDCVIGMSQQIGDEAAIVFAASFYRAIGFGRSIKQAFEQGKVALLLEEIPEERTPELICRSGIDSAQVFLQM